MNYDWTQSLCSAIIQKPMEKSYWLFVEGTSFMLTADPPTEWRHSSPTLFEPESDDETLKWLIDKRLIRKHDVFLSGKCQVLTSLW